MAPTPDSLRTAPLVAALGAPWTGEDAVSLFPGEEAEGISFSQDRLIELSALFGRFNTELVAAAGAELARLTGAPRAAALVLAREAAVPPAHLLLDRLLRLDLLVRRNPKARLRVPAPERAPLRARVSALMGLAHSSWDLNQDALARLAPLYGLDIERLPALPAKPPASSPRFVNHNFDGASVFEVVRRKFYGLLARLPAPGRIPALSLAYAMEPLKAEGFFASRLENVHGRWRACAAAIDPAARRALRGALAPALAAPLSRFLDEAGAGTRRSEAAGILADYLVDAWPEALLEAVPRNLASALDVLRPFAPGPLIGSEIRGEEGVFLVAAAKALGMPLVSVQHGGHYGYLDDLAVHVEMEFSLCDRFISWGWTGLPDRDVCRDVPVTPLPSPWLNARRRYWERALPPAERDPRGKKHDLLLMSNKVYRFPPAPSGAGICRSDQLRVFADALKELVAAAAERGVSILHKPYNRDTVELMPGAFAELEKLGGSSYRLYDRFDKGMTPALLRSAGAIVWDQPGTGFLECLTSGLPCFVLWKRSYNREEPRWRPLFKELERAGLVHRDAASLLAAYASFKEAPAAWTAEPSRRGAVERFKRALARDDDDWPRQWRAALSALRAGKPDLL